MPRCSHCGGNMTIDYIDEYTQMPGYKNPTNIIFIILGGYFFLQFFPFVLVLCCIMPISFFTGGFETDDGYNDHYYEDDYNYDDENTVSNLDIYGTTIYLDHIGNNIFQQPTNLKIR